jgi:hypothetical protein
MGILDDAIREHLDLKRRRGADPTEIERAERDALGPVRRGPEAEEVDLDHVPAADDELAYADEDEQDWAEQGAHEPGARAPASPQGYEPAFEDEDEPRDSEEHFDGEEPFDERAADTIPEPYAAPEPPRPDPTPPASEPESTEPELAERDRRAPAPPAPDVARRDPGSSRQAPHDRAGGETAEFNVEFDEEPGVQGEDVLEETPEFLQDTPDHDRLWFEQRPPKDFDFDG